ncbi:response regulator [Herbidospora cretacea]|uniref:response regulator n=1 Tax=Herbidospora cretacea TaxID=28444 RepID=UPI0012FB5107|nr:response regulator transcription factor [Herbidospora cretacea]
MGSVEVLIVDDQAPFRAVARRLVALVAGWRVAGEAESGEDAVALAVQTRPHVIVMDINLPGISGVEATRRILADQPGITVVLVSTYAAEDLPPGASDCGAAGYIRKEDLTPARLRASLAAMRPPMPWTPAPGGVDDEQR